MKEIVKIFLKLGITAFGGPAAHIAMMEDEIVRRRGWITHEHFLDLLGATNLIPGPNSTEMAIHIGYIRAGWKGLILAGLCFISPAVLITLILAYLYRTFGSLPQAGSFTLGIRAGIIAVILAAMFRLSKPFKKNPPMIFLGLLVAVLNFLSVDEIVLLLGAGVLGLIWHYRSKLTQSTPSIILLAAVVTLLFIVPGAGTALTYNGPTLMGIGLFFLKIGSILYGSGYVLVAFLQGGLVNSRHWLTQTQLLDAIAVGQFTPGPVLSTATFIGYLMLGIPGALVATIGIFLPSFVFVVISSPFIPKLRSSPLMRGFLDGVNAAALGLMLAVSITLMKTTLSSVPTWVIFMVSLASIVRWNLNAIWIITGAAILSWALSLIPFFAS